MELRTTGNYAGYIEYHPHTTLSKKEQELLSEILEYKRVTEECENPAVLLDWSAVNKEGPPYHDRTYIVLYSDGGDAFDPGYIFFRIDTHHEYGKQTNKPATVHIPSPEGQKLLLENWDWDRHGGFKKLENINVYLNSVLNSNEQWLDFKALVSEMKIPNLGR